ncbi:hypothetical protein ES045_02555 [Polaribacter sp. IC073]|nr:hypothetical protein ES045_02555 [Polaribacter sp. IC073]
MATKNYIQIISYNNYIKTNENLSTEVKMFLNFFNRNITKRLNNLKEISRDELILLPHVNEVVFHDKNSSYKEKKNEFKLLKNLNTLIDNQLDVLKRLVNNSNNTAIHVFANDSGDFIQEQKYNIKSIINKN